MKKITFFAMLIAVGAMILTGCQNKDTATEPTQPVKTVPMTFYASSQAKAEAKLRTGLAYDGITSVWTEGDQIKIFTTETKTGNVFTLKKGAGTALGIFEGESVESTGYAAAYPASLASSPDGGTIIFNLPSSQAYQPSESDKGTYAPNIVPVVAYSGSNQLMFENTTGMLRVGVQLKSGTSATVKSMVLTDKNSSAKLWGKFKITAATSPQALVKDGEDGDNTMTISLPEVGFELSSSKYTYFYFCLPVGTLASGFTIDMEDADGKTAQIDYTIDGKKTELGVGKALEQSGVEFKLPPTTGEAEIKGGTKVKWVQLWKNGPKWAEYNVGATSVGDYGGYYCWGGSYRNGEGATWEEDYVTGSILLSGDTDTATKLWGSNWCMPKRIDFEHLVGLSGRTVKTNYVWKNADESGYGVAGLLCTGIEEGYTENSVFFPAAGYYATGGATLVGSNADYWCNMYAIDNKACILQAPLPHQYMCSEFRSRALSVRAVLVE